MGTSYPIANYSLRFKVFLRCAARKAWQADVTMTCTKTLFLVSFIGAVLTAPAFADSFVYVVNVSQQFGEVDLNTGTFTQIGPNTPQIDQGLVTGPSGSLLTLSSNGNLDSINPATGVTTVIGATGLGDCSTPLSPCGPTSAMAIVGFGGGIYATDYHNDLYKINPSTGAATLINATGIPAVPFPPFSTNPDGSFNYFDETLFDSGGKLYATFDAGTFNPATFQETSLVVPDLYQINPTTGLATLVASTTRDLAGAINLNGTVYAFDSPNLLTLNPTNGSTTFVRSLDPASGIVDGAAPVPEPCALELAAFGTAAIFLFIRRRHNQ